MRVLRVAALRLGLVVALVCLVDGNRGPERTALKSASAVEAPPHKTLDNNKMWMIQGVVVGSDGFAVSGYPVVALAEDGVSDALNANPSGLRTFEVMTDVNGRFELLLRRYISGAIAVLVDVRDHVPCIRRWSEIPSESMTDLGAMRLQSGATIGGKLISSQRRDWPRGTRVMAEPLAILEGGPDRVRGVRSVRDSIVRENGKYLISGIGSGPVVLVVTFPDGWVHIGPSVAVEGSEALTANILIE
jgi:hypothetical protein